MVHVGTYSIHGWYWNISPPKKWIPFQKLVVYVSESFSRVWNVCPQKNTPKTRPFADLIFDTQTEGLSLGKYIWIDIPWKSKTIEKIDPFQKKSCSFPRDYLFNVRLRPRRYTIPGWSFFTAHMVPSACLVEADQDTTPRCGIKRLHGHKITFTGSYSSHLTQEFRIAEKARFKGWKVGGGP